MGLAERGMFVRGGIAVGDLYVDESIVFGVALLDAYETEQSADTPRVVLAPSAVEAVYQHLRYYGKVSNAPQSGDLLIDEDGKWFVNYLSDLWPDRTEPPIFEWLESHATAVSERLVRFKGSPKILSKYVWAARYHNYFCEHLPGGNGYLLDIGIPPLAAVKLEDDPEVARRHK
jgi:hypothetical protein